MRRGSSRLNGPHVIFDLDGTLVKYKLKINEARRDFLNYLRGLGVNVDGLTEQLPTNEIIRKVAKGDEDLIREIMRSANLIFSRYEMEAAELSEPRDCALEVLEAFKDLGVKIAVATNNSRRPAETTLYVTGMERLISVLITRDDVSKIKPEPEMLVKSAYYLRAPLNSCIHVGDSYIDILAARKVGMFAVAVMGGASPRDKLLMSRPHMLINSLKELLVLAS